MSLAHGATIFLGILNKRTLYFPQACAHARGGSNSQWAHADTAAATSSGNKATHASSVHTIASLTATWWVVAAGRPLRLGECLRSLP